MPTDAEPTDAELHINEEHPDFEYANTQSFDHYPSGGLDGWYRNQHKSPSARVLETGFERAFWMKRKDYPQQRNRFREYYPYSIDDYFEAVGLRRPSL